MPPPLHTLRLDPLAPFNRIHAFLYSAAILALFYHHLTSLPTFNTVPLIISHSLLILSDLVFAFMWGLAQAFRWRPVRRQESPHRLLEVVDPHGLPALDVFICTADPSKEPPTTVASTALSVMAYDYPSERISVYVSDDGGSDVTLLALMEAAKFARCWLPFCTENGIAQRAPEAYFASAKDGDSSENMKIMYEKMKQKIENAMEKGYVDSDLPAVDEEYDIFKKWKGFSRGDHPSVIRVLVESSNDTDIMGNAMPNLVYVSREKRPKSPHHFKAGALNALVRVSSVMSNSPVILTLDCDMHSNDPQTPQRALCYILDPALSPTLAFVQFPQRYQGLNKNDIYGGEIKRLFRVNAHGMDGLRGPNYVGTGCFFQRRSLYGPPPSSTGQIKLGREECSMVDGSMHSESLLKMAHEVAGCRYELDRKWGSTIGFRYGSLVEDFFTGYRLQCEGWKSVLCDPQMPAFLGDAPKNLDDTLGQCKRWSVGLLEVGISKYNPLIFGTNKVSLLMGMCYAHYSFWGIWCIPITTYALLPPLALIYDVPLFPKLSDPWFYLYVYLFVAAYCQDLIEFLRTSGTIQRWWSDQRIWMIRGLTSFLFGTIQFAINNLGLATPGFSITSKVMEDGQSERYENGMFDFGITSPFFISLGTVAIINLSSFLLGTFMATKSEGYCFAEIPVQLFLSAFVTVNCWPVIEAMFVRRDAGKIHRNITITSILLAGLICVTAYFAFAE